MSNNHIRALKLLDISLESQSIDILHTAWESDAIDVMTQVVFVGKICQVDWAEALDFILNSKYSYFHIDPEIVNGIKRCIELGAHNCLDYFLSNYKYNSSLLRDADIDCAENGQAGVDTFEVILKHCPNFEIKDCCLELSACSYNKDTQLDAFKYFIKKCNGRSDYGRAAVDCFVRSNSMHGLDLIVEEYPDLFDPDNPINYQSTLEFAVRAGKSETIQWFRDNHAVPELEKLIYVLSLKYDRVKIQESTPLHKRDTSKLDKQWENQINGKGESLGLVSKFLSIFKRGQ